MFSSIESLIRSKGLSIDILIKSYSAGRWIYRSIQQGTPLKPFGQVDAIQGNTSALCDEEDTTTLSEVYSFPNNRKL